MDCSFTFTNSYVKNDCHISILTTKETQSIVFIGELIPSVYTIKFRDQDAIMILTTSGPCDYVTMYPYFPVISFACIVNGGYGLISLGKYYALENYDISEYMKLFDLIMNSHYNSSLSGDILKTNILFNDKKAYFLRLESNRFVEDSLITLDRTFTPHNLVEPVWENFFMHTRNIDRDKILDTFDNKFKIERKLFNVGYDPKRKIDEGSFGIVYEVHKNNEKYAVKMLKYNSKRLEIDLTDLSFSQLFKFPYIVRTKEFTHVDEYMGIVMELADTNLAIYLENKLTTEMKYKLIYQLGSALEYIDRLGYVHCDIKPNNILIKNGNVLLADFGMIRLKGNTTSYNCQLDFYKAPENANIVAEIENVSDISSDGKGKNKGKYKISRIDMLEEYHKKYSGRIVGIHNERWSYGIICLEIIYNKPYITRDAAISDGESYYYHDVINELVRSKSSYVTIRKIYGTPREYSLLRYVCDNLLQLDPTKRVDYNTFLGDNLFDSFRLPGLSTFKASYSNCPPVVTSEHVSKTVKMMFDVCDNTAIPPYVTYNAVDFFLCKQHKYIDPFNPDEYTLLGLICIWIFGQIHLSKRKHYELFINAGVYDYYTDDIIINKTIEVIVGEKGKLIVDSIYNYLSSSEMLLRAKEIMIDTQLYAKLGIQGTASKIISNVT